MDALRKPLTLFGGLISVLVAVWFVGSIDTSIKKR